MGIFKQKDKKLKKYKSKPYNSPKHIDIKWQLDVKRLSLQNVMLVINLKNSINIQLLMNLVEKDVSSFLRTIILLHCSIC